MQENFQCEQSAFEKSKFQNSISQFRTCSILRNFAAEISLMEHCDWSIGSAYKHRYEALAMLLTAGFGKFISSVKSAHFRKKNFKIFLGNGISKLISNVKGALKNTAGQSEQFTSSDRLTSFSKI